jgi:caspase domain-containing protein
MLRLWALSIGLMVAAPALADQRVALVIGNDAYSSVPVLQKAAADAHTMGASLSKLGFDVDSGARARPGGTPARNLHHVFGGRR